MFTVIATIFLFVPGFALLTRFKLLNSNLERIVFAPFVGVALAGGLGLLHAAGLVSNLVIQVISAVVLCLALWQIYSARKNIKIDREIIRLLAIYGAFFVITTTYVAMPLIRSGKYIPDPEYVNGSNYSVLNVKVLNLARTAANDNFVPYRQAQFFSNRISIQENPYLQPEWGVNFFFRTPLMGLVTSYHYSLTNTKPPYNYPWRELAFDTSRSYLKFQLLAQLLNGLLVLPGYLLLRKLFNKRVAFISAALFALNAFFISNSFFTWPKSFVAFFVLAAVYIVLNYRNYLFAGIIIGFAYLAHDLAALYAAGLFFMALTEERYRLKHLVELVVPLLLFVLPWYYVSRIVYKQTSLFIYYPISIKGMPQRTDGLLKEFLQTSPWEILRIKLQSLAFLVTPYQLIFERGKLFDLFWGVSVFTVPGAMGIALAPFALLKIIEKWRKAWRTIMAIVVIPILVAVLMIGWPKGLGAMHFAEASVLLLVGFGVAMLVSQKLWLRYLILALLVLQSGLFLFGNFDYQLNDLVNGMAIIKLCLFMLSVVGILWIIWQELLHDA